jgi:UDP:flavonoid glycosyltransferase YjiC (YdhE family)
MQRKILFLSSNGIGLGHLTRQMAVATRMDAGLRPVFHTMAQAASLVRDAGFPVLFHQHHGPAKLRADRWNEALAAELESLVRWLAPAAVVIDSTAIFGAYVRVLHATMDIPRLWLRRPMWQDENRHFIDQAHLFTEVLEPGELAADLDDGPTVGTGATALPPILHISPHQRQSREMARRLLGVDGTDRPLVALQLGHALGPDTAAVRALALAALRARGAEVIDIRSPLEPTVTGETGVRTLTLYPSYALSTGFDAMVTAAGYNSFHECLLGRIPSLFVPATGRGMDRQDLRAGWACARGLAQTLAKEASLADWQAAIDRLLSPGFARVVADSTLADRWENGAFAAARRLRQRLES